VRLVGVAAQRRLETMARKKRESDMRKIALPADIEALASRGLETFDWKPLDTAPRDGSQIALRGRGWRQVGFWRGGWHLNTVRVDKNGEPIMKPYRLPKQLAPPTEWASLE
jgi:hypothetical protein